MIKFMTHRLCFALAFGAALSIAMPLMLTSASFAYATGTNWDSGTQNAESESACGILAASETECNSELEIPPAGSTSQEPTPGDTISAYTGGSNPETDPESSGPATLVPGWNKRNDGAWLYALEAGTVKTGWLKDKGHWYWLDPADGGKMATGLQTIKGIAYHFAPSGKMSVGWAKESGSWYYANPSGALQSGWLKDKGHWYWLDPNNGGKMAAGLFNAKGEWFVAKNNGSTVINGWALADGAWYRTDSRGETLTGWFNNGAKAYWLEPSLHGAMAVGLFSVDEASYFATASGAVAKNAWVENEGKTLFADKDGVLGGEALRTEDGGLVLIDSDGTILSGWQTLGGCTFYANPENENKLTKGWFMIDGTWYWANSNHVLGTGWQKINSKWYWLTPETGAMKTGWLKDSGTWYYLSDSGTMKTGWLLLGDTWYYLKSNGAMVTGSYKINGNLYRFANNGAWISPEAAMTKKAQSFSSKTSWLILVDCTNNYVGIFKGSQDNWAMHKYIRCTSGAYSSPTVKGTFTVGAKGLHFGEKKGYTCWYYTQFCGNYLFHTVLYSPYSKTNIIDGRLGINASHGCVRLSMENAKWIYDNIPKETKVHVY